MLSRKPPSQSTSLLSRAGPPIRRVAVSIGCTLGVGILRQPGPVGFVSARAVADMLVWFGGAVYSALGGAQRVGTRDHDPARRRLLRSHGARSHGRHSGFAAGWSDFLANVAASAYAAMAAVEFLGRLIPATASHASLTASGFILRLLRDPVVRYSHQRTRAAGRVRDCGVGLIGLVAACFTIPPPHDTLPVSPAPAAQFHRRAGACHSVRGGHLRRMV